MSDAGSMHFPGPGVFADRAGARAVSAKGMTSSRKLDDPVDISFFIHPSSPLFMSNSKASLLFKLRRSWRARPSGCLGNKRSAFAKYKKGMNCGIV
jgi:hypothetical protein